MGTERINIDDLEPRPERRLHSTLKKCRCGFVDTKYKVEQHILGELRVRRTDQVEEFWKHHGEVPLNVDDPTLEEFANLNWMKGQHPNYND